MTYKQIIKKLEKDYAWGNTKTFNPMHRELIKDVSEIVLGDNRIKPPVVQDDPVFIEIEEDKVITEVTIEDEVVWVSGNIEKCRLIDLTPIQINLVAAYLIKENN
jgi:hypothetical protein